MSKRPPAPIRILILLVALLALGSAVCARSQSHPETAPPAQAAPETAAAPDAGKPADAEFFPATKSGGYLIQEDEKQR